MDAQSEPCVLFIVEDDAEDRHIFKSELIDRGLESGAYFFSDFSELISFHRTHDQRLQPSLILLASIVPVTFLQNAVTFIKSIQEFRSVPLVVMVSSKNEKEYLQPYNLNVSGYVTKPVYFRMLKRFLQTRETTIRP